MVPKPVVKRARDETRNWERRNAWWNKRSGERTQFCGNGQQPARHPPITLPLSPRVSPLTYSLLQLIHTSVHWGSSCPVTPRLSVGWQLVKRRHYRCFCRWWCGGRVWGRGRREEGSSLSTIFTKCVSKTYYNWR